MLDGEDPQSCGRCHDGAVKRPAKVTFAAPGAPACTSCHTENGGVLACSTCHGDGTPATAQRDPSAFPVENALTGAHGAHVAKGLPCSTCHPVPGGEVLAGLHANGQVEIVFDTARVAPESSFDKTTLSCAVSCHDRGGTRARPVWTETGSLKCNSCHGAPPAAHYPGKCSACHKEANADGTALVPGPLHLNGKVDLGDGRGACGACHGKPDDPWPDTGAHAAHRTPDVTLPVTCGSCHVVPQEIHAPGHMNGKVDVTLAGRAADRGVAPTFESGACSVACHGAGMRDQTLPLPSWTAPAAAVEPCQGCHRSPPTQHTPSTGCDRSTCHGGEIARDGTGAVRVTLDGKSHHIDGVFDHVR